MDNLEGVINNLIDTYGYERVVNEVNRHAPLRKADHKSDFVTQRRIEVENTSPHTASTIKELAARYSVSESTVRADLKYFSRCRQYDRIKKQWERRKSEYLIRQS